MTETAKSKLNGIFWALIFVLVAAGIVANNYFNEIAWALRFAGWIVLAIVVVGLLSRTYEGKKLWRFAQEARVELRKVVWPTKDETIKTTMVIAALVICMAFILWGVDSVLMWAIGWLSGQRG